MQCFSEMFLMKQIKISCLLVCIFKSPCVQSLPETLTGDVAVNHVFLDAVSVLAAVLLPGKRCVLPSWRSLYKNTWFRTNLYIIVNPEHEKSFLGLEIRNTEDV